MSEPAVQVQAIMATPACMQPRRTPVEAFPPRRATARQLLEAALAGVRLGCRDQQFLSRLVHRDKRNAASVASLLDRARQAGHEAGIGEAGLTQRQRELIIGALGEAAFYRASGAAAASCWDCEIVPGGRCAEHARDFDRAGAYADLARVLAGTAPGPAPVAPVVPVGPVPVGPVPVGPVPVGPVPAALPLPGRDRPRDLSGYRHRTPVAS
jgi:hypothetical protein